MPLIGGRQAEAARPGERPSAAPSPPRSLGHTLSAALVAGLIAALATGAFHFLASEPVVDAAIALEEASRAPAAAQEAQPLVSREAQKGGLFLAWLLYGALWACLVAAAAHLAQPRRARHAALLALAFGWAVAIYPALKYPASPPGAGDPETLPLRQALYLSALGVALAGAGAARLVAARTGLLAALAAYAALLAVAFVALPPGPDSSSVPAGLEAPFRALSLAGLGLFWAVFAALFAWLSSRRPGTAPTRPVSVGGTPRRPTAPPSPQLGQG